MLIADTHVHIYPCYDLNGALENAQNNLSRSGKAAGFDRFEKGIFLAERSDCDCWRILKEKGEWSEGGVKIRSDVTGDHVWIFPGRQIVTAEKVEILSLLCEERIADGESTDSTVRRVVDAGGLPVFCWAPGKWFGERGKIVRRILEGPLRDRIFAGDTALRCRPVPEPDVFKAGRPVLAGSDPLPFAGEERMIGTYCSAVDVQFSGMHSLRDSLMRCSYVQRTGNRCTPVSAFCRFVENEYQRRKQR